jgi:ABC-type transport system involved in cytochrome c biogenesis permease subunit
MTHLFFMLGFISLYSLGMLGGRKGHALYVSGLLLHAAYIVSRWLSMDHIPVSDKHDILSLVAFISALSFLYLHYIKKITDVMNVLPLLPVFLCMLSLFQERINTINPNMDSVWFYLYMIFFIVGFAMLGIGTVLGVMYLLKTAGSLEPLQYRFTLAGWIFFSVALIAGSVWFYLAYGVYWLWTAKELWTTIVWFYYGFYLHARLLNSLKGPIAAEVGASGFIVLLFAYLGVTPILGSPWTQF